MKIEINYKAEVLSAYPLATAKHWSYDNGHGISSFWSISKDNVCVTYTPDRYLSGQMKTEKQAWENAYTNIPKKVQNPFADLDNLDIIHGETKIFLNIKTKIMKKRIVYQTKWVAADKNKEYPHGWGFDAPLVMFDQNKDPAQCNEYCKNNLSNEEFICTGATPHQLLVHPESENIIFLSKLINTDESEDKKIMTEYTVKFYDWPEMKVWAINDLQAGILAMAHVIHDKGAGFQIEYITSGRTGLKIP